MTVADWTIHLAPTTMGQDNWHKLDAHVPHMLKYISHWMPLICSDIELLAENREEQVMKWGIVHTQSRHDE